MAFLATTATISIAIISRMVAKILLAMKMLVAAMAAMRLMMVKVLVANVMPVVTMDLYQIAVMSDILRLKIPLLGFQEVNIIVH